MIDAETILKMIETVDQTDRDRLDEIDQAVCDYLGKIGRPLPRYTRSRDALKEIRPQGFLSGANPDFDDYEDTGNIKFDGFCESEDRLFGGLIYSSTEELAELHAIILAIAYERNLRGKA